MSGDSQATSFSDSVRNKIRTIYDYRCVICLAWIPLSQCAHIIDESQLIGAIKLHVLPNDYESNAPTNGMVQCPSCHAYFTSNYIVLSLPIPILKYIEKYVSTTPKVHQKPLHEVFHLLTAASEGESVDLPDYQEIMPYIGLFTIVTLNPSRVIDADITTKYLPNLSIIHDTQFVPAAENTSATADNVARIFDPLSITTNTPRNFGMIPISPNDKAYKEKRYWRIPASTAAIFAALIARRTYDQSWCEDIVLVIRIYSHLALLHLDPNGGSSDNSAGGSGSGRSGQRGGRGRDGMRQSKRRGLGDRNKASQGRSGKKKARTKDGENGESDNTAVHSECGRQCNQQEIAAWSSSLTTEPLSDDSLAHIRETDLLDGSESNTWDSISQIDPPKEDNPDEWWFGPSFTTNKIVFTVRGVRLT